MKIDAFVKKRVSEYYWKDDLNCATTTLKILSESFKIALHKQTIDASFGMHGAGGYGAQCGLVEGALMFLGVFGRDVNIADNEIIASCRAFARQFEDNFGSLQCSLLRPEGFDTNNPPHLCESLTCKAVEFSIGFVSAFKERPKQLQFIVKG